MGKMDPCAYDRWWRSRIEKEEGTYASKTFQAASKTVVLNTLGAPQEVVAVGNESHLKGAAAVVRQQPQAASCSAGASPAQSPVAPKAPRSIAGSQVGSRVPDDARSRASGRKPSDARSNISYPRTPAFSAAGSATDTEIMGRLAKLEQELLSEKVRREAAEQEMRHLLTSSAGPASVAGSGRR